MPGSTMSISTASNVPCVNAIRRCLTAADEFCLVTEFGKDRVEHHAAERIVLDAEHFQRQARLAGLKRGVVIEPQT